MEVKPVEIYSEASNFGIVRLPGRAFPGSLIQGDSLASLCSAAKRVVEGIMAKGINDEELLGDLEALYHSLLERLLDHQETIQKAGFSLPYSRPLKREDFIRLTPGTDPDESRS